MIGVKMNSKKTGRAFTIIEVIVIIVIIGVIAAVVAPRLFQRIGQSKTAMAKSNGASLATAVSNYIADCGMPEQGATIDILVDRPSNVDEAKWKGPYVQNREMLLDPWGKKFDLRVPPTKNADFDVVSLGADGQEGGVDENQDIISP